MVHQLDMKLLNKPSLLCMMKVARNNKICFCKLAKAVVTKAGIESTGVSKTNWWRENKVTSQGKAHSVE